MSNEVQTSTAFVSLMNENSKAELTFEHVRKGVVADDLSSVEPKGESIEVVYRTNLGHTVRFELTPGSAQHLVDKINEISVARENAPAQEWDTLPTLAEGEVLYFKSNKIKNSYFRVDGYNRLYYKHTKSGGWVEIKHAKDLTFSGYAPLVEIPKEESEPSPESNGDNTAGYSRNINGW